MTGSTVLDEDLTGVLRPPHRPGPRRLLLVSGTSHRHSTTSSLALPSATNPPGTVDPVHLQSSGTTWVPRSLLRGFVYLLPQWMSRYTLAHSLRIWGYGVGWCTCTVCVHVWDMCTYVCVYGTRLCVVSICVCGVSVCGMCARVVCVWGL